MKVRRWTTMLVLVGLLIASNVGASIWPAIGLTGGTLGTLDSISGSLLSNADSALVILDGTTYTYFLDATSGAAESSPDVISPDSNAGTKRWVLNSIATTGLDARDGGITNVGNIALDSMSSDDGTDITVTLGSDSGDDFNIDSGTLICEGDLNKCTIASLVATTIDANGGTIDGATIGGASAAAGTFTAIVGTSASISDGNVTNVGDIALDSLSSDDGTDIALTLGDGAGDDFNVNSNTFNVSGDTDNVGYGGGAVGYAFSTWVRSFLSDGSSDNANMLNISGSVTGANGDTTNLSGSFFKTTITTQSNSETITSVEQVRIDEPVITIGTDTITTASSLHITGQPTEGASNYAAWIEGDVKIDGTLVGASSAADYAGMTVDDNVTATSIGLVDSYYKFRGFAEDMPENDSNADYVADTITIGQDGDYSVTFAAAGFPDVGNKTFDFQVFSLGTGVNITAATVADPVVVTATGHGLVGGERIAIKDVVGMVEVNDRVFVAQDISGATFELTDEGGASPANDIDGSGFTAYSSGGTVHRVGKVKARSHRKFSAGGSADYGAFGGTAIATLAEDEEVELYLKGDTDTTDFTIEDVSMQVEFLAEGTDPAICADWLGDWERRIPISISSTNVDSTLTNFPMLIYISASSGTGNADISVVFDELTADGNRKKIAVTAVDGITQRYVEIERWDDANEVAWLWVKVPSVSASATTTLCLYYDSDQADNSTYVGDTTDAVTHNVWDANFVGVWHMAQDPNGDPANGMKDSTSNGYDGTPGGTMLTADLVDGHIGKAIDFDAVDDHVNVGTWTDLNGATAATWEATAIGPALTAVDLAVMGRWNAASQFILQVDDTDDVWEAAMYDSAGSQAISISPGLIAADTTFQYLAVVYDTTTANLYVDLADGGSDTNGSFSGGLITAGGTDMYLGADQDNDHNLGDKLDEVRISDTDRSVAWLKATKYSNDDNIMSYAGPQLRD